MNQWRELAVRRFAGFDGPVLILIFGMMMGVVVLKSWAVAVALSMFVVTVGIAMRSVFVIWLFLIINMLFVSNYFGPPVSTFSFWGLLMIFNFSVWWDKRITGRAIVFGDRFFWVAMLSWYSWGIMATLFSPDFLLSMREIGRYGILFFTFFTFMQWLTNENSLRHALKALWILLMIYAVLTIPKLILEGSNTGLLLGNHWHTQVESGGYFVAFLPVFGSLLRYMRGHNWIKGLGILLLFSAVFLSHSATAVLAAGVGMLAVLALKLPPSGQRIMAWGFFASMGFLILGLLYTKGIHEWLIYQLSGRDRIWAAALHASTSHPLFGVGPGRWQAWFSTEYMSADFILDDLRGNIFYLDPATLSGQAHNLFLTKAAEMGIPSFIFLVCIFVSWFLKTLSVYRLPLDGWRHDLVRGCLSSFIGLTCFCLFENGPIIGEAREGEVLIITLILAIPLIVEYTQKTSLR